MIWYVVYSVKNISYSDCTCIINDHKFVGILHITSKVVDTFFDEPKWP